MRKNTFYTAVLLLAGAVMAACSGDGDMTSDITPGQQTPMENGVVELVGTLGSKKNMTRTTIDETFADHWNVGDQFAIYYETANNGYATAVATLYGVKELDGSAEYRATLKSPKMGNNRVTLVYPASAHDGKGGFNTDLLMNQGGSVNFINENKLDFQKAETIMNVEGTSATLTENVSLDPQICLCTLNLYKAGKEQIDFRSLFTKKLEINDGTHNYTVTLDETRSGHTVVALLPTTNATFTYTAASAEEEDLQRAFSYVKDFEPENITVSDIGNVILPDNKVYECSTGPVVYSKTYSGVTLVAGKWYRGNVTGIDLELESVSDVPPVAMIAYVGSATGEPAYNHGLAIAMKDNTERSCRWMKCSNSYNTINNTYQWSGDGSPASESGLQYRIDERISQENSGWPAFWSGADPFIHPGDGGEAAQVIKDYDPTAHGFSPWFLCSAYQWNQMIEACKNVTGNTGTAADLSHAFLSRANNRANKELSQDLSGSYWTSTECSGRHVWAYRFDNGEYRWEAIHKNEITWVRSVLAF